MRPHFSLSDTDRSVGVMRAHFSPSDGDRSVGAMRPHFKANRMTVLRLVSSSQLFALGLTLFPIPINIYTTLVSTSENCCTHSLIINKVSVCSCR